MRAQFEGQAAVAMAAARAKVAADIEAAGGREAWRAQNAQRQLVADAWRRAEAAQAAVTAAEQALARAQQAAEQAVDAAEGLWTVSLGPVGRTVSSGYLGGFASYAEAEAAAERSRAAGRGASVHRPHCQHDVPSYARSSAEGPCRSCAKAKR